MSRLWIWELVTPDGHVANASAEFGTRDECEADARKQGLPVSGLRRRSPRVEPTAESARQAPGSWAARQDDSGLWHWQRVDERSRVVAESACAFLTREECVADALKHGGTRESEAGR